MPDLLTRLQAALADRYRLEREVGAGGMATVYLAQDLRHDRKVAVKVLRPELAAVIGAERFLSEIKTTANLQHPHILPLFDSGQAESFLFYVMPFVEGESLRDRLTREKQLPIPDAVRVACEIASALDYAHRHGVIHRDIKPENILLHDGRALVADFGIALAVGKAGATRMTETGMSLGTPLYMSPEQAMGEREITARSDVYALGCVTYEMLTGDPPFTGSTAQAIVAKVLTEEPRPLLPQRHTIPPHVEAAVLGALEKLPADRFATAAEFIEVLEGRRQVVTAAGQTRLPRVPPPVANWRIGALGVAAGALFVAALFLLVARRPPEPVEHWPIAPLPGLDTIPLNHVLAISPDGTHLVYTVTNPDGKRRLLHLRALDQPEGTPLLGTEDGSFPVFSPDGRKIAFLVPSGSLRWISIEGGAPQTLAEADRGEFCWGRDAHIYFSRKASDSLPAGISRVADRGGQPEAVTTIDSTRAELTHTCFQVLPSGRGLLYNAGRAGGLAAAELATYSFATRHSEILLHSPYGRLAPGGYLVYITPTRTLSAAPFDEKALKLTGPPVTLADNVFVNPDGFAAFALSTTGTLLYAHMEPRLSRLAWVDRRGTATGINTSHLQEFETFALSPDGHRIAAGITRDGISELWVYELPNGPWVRLVTGGDVDFRPDWEPDGTRIAFIMVQKNGIRAAWTIPADGGGPKQLLRQASPIVVQDGEWSPDGAWFVYRQGPSGPTQRDVLYARPDPDSAPHPLAVTAADEFAPTLSPDGHWLAYVSNASGREEVLVQPFPGPGRRIQVSLDGGLEPRWAHSGREIFYRDHAGNLVAVDVRTGAAFAVGGRRILFPARGYLNDRNSILYDVAPDDERFLFVQPMSGGEITWMLVRGFLNEVKARVGR